MVEIFPAVGVKVSGRRRSLQAVGCVTKVTGETVTPVGQTKGRETWPPWHAARCLIGRQPAKGVSQRKGGRW